MGFSSYPVGSTPLRHRQLRRRVPARLTAPLLHKQDFFYNTYGLPTAWHRDNYTAAWNDANTGHFFLNSVVVTVRQRHGLADDGGRHGDGFAGAWRPLHEQQARLCPGQLHRYLLLV